MRRRGSVVALLVEDTREAVQVHDCRHVPMSVQFPLLLETIREDLVRLFRFARMDEGHPVFREDEARIRILWQMRRTHLDRLLEM